MAVSSPSIQSADFASATGASFYEKLNSQWHERALQIFHGHRAGALGRTSGAGLPDLGDGLAAAQGERHSWACGIPG